MFNFRKITGAVALSLLLAGPASAQTMGNCMRNGQLDPEATRTLQRLLAQPNPQVMQAMAGTWYAMIQSPNTGQVSYNYASYGPDGSWGYQNRVCGGMMNMCMDYQGFGIFAGVPIAGGQISLIIMYSDSQVNNACIGNVVQPMGDGTLRDSTGQTWQRIR